MNRTIICPRCSGQQAMADGDQLPRWCKQCGSTLRETEWQTVAEAKEPAPHRWLRGRRFWPARVRIASLYLVVVLIVCLLILLAYFAGRSDPPKRTDYTTVEGVLRKYEVTRSNGHDGLDLYLDDRPPRFRVRPEEYSQPIFDRERFSTTERRGTRVTLAVGKHELATPTHQHGDSQDTVHVFGLWDEGNVYLALDDSLRAIPNNFQVPVPLLIGAGALAPALIAILLRRYRRGEL